MRISIVTPCFNSADTLADTIESVLSQTYPDVEHVIIDGGSSDGTVGLIQKYEPRYGGRLRWISGPDKGIYDAMNKGIALATGDVVGILNSDDFFYDREVVADIASAFNRDTDCTFGNLLFVSKTDKTKVVRIWKGSPYRNFTTGWHPAHPTFYIRHAHLLSFGGFNTRFGIAADFELMLRMIERYHLATKYIDRYMVCMRMGGKSTGKLINIIKGNIEAYRAFSANDIRITPLYPLRRLATKAVGVITHFFK